MNAECEHGMEYPHLTCATCRNGWKIKPNLPPGEAWRRRLSRERPFNMAEQRKRQVDWCQTCNVERKFVEQRMCNTCHHQAQWDSIVQAELFDMAVQNNPTKYVKGVRGGFEHTAEAAMHYNAFLHRRAHPGIPSDEVFMARRPPTTR